jgi:hypothetical protein
MSDEVEVKDVEVAPEAEKAEKKVINRRQFRNDEWTEEEVAARRQELTLEEAPEDWLKIQEVDEIFRAEGIATSRLVRAIGGDRGMNPPINDHFQVRYVGRQRYLPPTSVTEGLALLKSDANVASTPRKPRAKKEKVAKAEKAEGDESGPVRGTKKDRPKPQLKNKGE